MGIEAPKHGLTGKGSRWSPLDNIDPARAAKIKADIAAAKARREGKASGEATGANAEAMANKRALEAGTIHNEAGQTAKKWRSGADGSQGQWVKDEAAQRKNDPYGEKAALAARNKRRAAEGLPPLKG